MALTVVLSTFLHAVLLGRPDKTCSLQGGAPGQPAVLNCSCRQCWCHGSGGMDCPYGRWTAQVPPPHPVCIQGGGGVKVALPSKHCTVALELSDC